MMNLESQVTSLELSKRLKELGVQQESLFHWYVSERSGYSFILESKEVNYCVDSQDKYEVYSAFTASALLELLPCKIIKNEITFYLTIRKGVNFHVHYDHLENKEINDDISSVCCDLEDEYSYNLSNECAKTLIYLIENNLWEYKAP